VKILPQKFIFFPGGKKNCEKVSPYFSLSGVKRFPNFQFFCFQIGTFLAQICNFFRKNGKFQGVKVSKLAFFGLKVSPHSYSFPPPLLLFSWQNIHLL